jgi:single-strand DNA-binding protein
MSDLNHITLIGRLTRDAELKYAQQTGTAVLSFSIAVGKSIPPKYDGGEWGHKTSFFDVVMFGKTAENKAKNLTKGRQVAIEGELQQDRWEKDGQQYSRVKIYASSIQILALPRDQAGGKGGASAGQDSGSGGSNDFEDDIPF